ncbi:MAG: nucleoside hydrolase [Alphaproteobacteria bacterium]|nr:nucleoside hydrolase [Alphaproteobacteria bacterium]
MLIIDTDGGVDDILCLAIAVKLGLAEDLAVTTCFGNVNVDRATSNVTLLARTMGVDIPVYKGAASSLDGAIVDAEAVHGHDGLGGASEGFFDPHARPLSALVPVALAREDRSIDIVAVGPATNIPGMIERFGAKIRSVTLMTGVVYDFGSLNHFSTFNAYGDPLALGKVVDQREIPVTLVPLDLCRKVMLPKSRLPAFDRFGAVGDILKRSHAFYMDVYRDLEGIEGCYPHDSLTLLCHLHPDRFHLVPFAVRVGREGEERGHLIVGKDATPTVQIAMGTRYRWAHDFFRFDWVEA